MSDIVERLNERASFLHDKSRQAQRALLTESARTILALRALLGEARAYVEEAVDANGGIDACEIHMRHDLEAIDAALATEPAP